MAKGVLTPSKPEGQRRRRNIPVHGDKTVTRDGAVRGPTFAKAMTGVRPPGGEWLTPVRAWFENWRRSPQAALFEITDWQRLAALALIVQSYYLKPTVQALAEIRLSEERWGATITDRMRARIKIEDDGPALLASVAPITSARDSIAARLARPGSEPVELTPDEAPF